MKNGDYIYYRNKFGAHEPARVLKVNKKTVVINSDGSGDTDPGIKRVSKKNVELQ